MLNLRIRKAHIDLCLLNRTKRSSFRSLLLNFTLDGSSLSLENVSLRKHPFLLALRRWGCFAFPAAKSEEKRMLSQARKMSATPGACIKQGLVRRPLCHKVNLPSYVARRPLCHNVNLPSCVARQPLCHKVNLPRCEARRRHLTMTCDIFGTGQMNTLTLCYLLRKTYKSAHSSAL